MSLSDKKQLITIFGGSGFVGRYVVQALAKEGYRIRVAVRRPELALHLQPLGGVGQIHAVQANINNEESVQHAVEGSDIVINLVGILFESGKQSFRNIHANGAEYIAKAARLAGAHTLIHMSAIGANMNSRSRYARTKALGERLVLEEFPGAVILRPSVIFGPEDKLFNRFAEIASWSPALPLIGRSGRTKIQPIYVGDVAQAVVNVLRGNAQKGQAYELGGPEVMTWRQVMTKTLEFSHRRRLLVWIPAFVAKWFMAPILGLLPNPMLTGDQVILLGYDNVVTREAVNSGRTLEGLGITEKYTVDSIVPAYLERFRPYGQFSGSKK